MPFRIKKLILSLVILAFLGGLAPIPVAHAQNTDFANLSINTAKWIWDKLTYAWDKTQTIREQVVYRAGMIAYKNALRTFLSRLAYDTATRLAEGGIGQSPLFNIKSMDAFVTDVGQTTLADTLDVLAKDNGFFNFDVCSPQDLNLRFAIHYSLFGNFNGQGPRGAPRCTLSQIAKTWTEWSQNIGRTYDTTNFLSTLRDSFKPEQNDVGIYLTVESSVRNQIAVQQANQALDRIANQGFLPVTEKISGFIKTPAKVSADAAAQLQQNAPISETVSTGDIVADSIGIFTNTLASKLMKQLLDKGLVDSQTVRSIGVYNWANRQLARTNAATQLASLAAVSYQSGFERTVDSLTQCPDANNPGPLDCVMSSQIVGAIEQGSTVKEAIAAGQLNAAGLVGFKSGGNPDYRTDFPYRSLVIMRINRIIPASWELAALYNIKTRQEKSLQDLINCYEDSTNDQTKADNRLPVNCRQDMNNNNSVDDPEDYNPYYHLVDPNWVLKAPESFCARKGDGYQVMSSTLVCSENNVDGTKVKSSDTTTTDVPTCDAQVNPDKPVLAVTRATDYCADRKSCLAEDDSGQCTGGYGYCLKEEPIWRFQGQACSAVYASCETFTVGNTQASLVRDSLKPCDSGDVGCQWYATTQKKEITNNTQNLSWNTTDKIYLNAAATDCPSDSAGCTNLSRMIQGVNLMFNGDFELASNAGAPEGWQVNNTCTLSLVRESFNNSNALKVSSAADVNCAVQDSGLIPIDSRFEFVLGGNAKAETAQNLNMIVQYFAGNQQAVGSQYTVSSPMGTDWTSFKNVLPQVPSAAEYARVSFVASGNVWYDNLQLAINKSFVVRHNNVNYSFDPKVYQTDYSQNTSYAKEFLKVAPDSLSCDGYNEILNDSANSTQAGCFANHHYWRDDIAHCVVSGDASCSNYAAYCSAEEVGCQGYKPSTTGDPEVSARTAAGDVCSAECVGYETYLETPSFFDKTETPNADSVYQNFIPSTGQACTADEVGCEEFTNLDTVAQGGEGKEYFTQLRQCISQTNANLNFYYTWEGSDTTGFQLKRWNLLHSNIDVSPCTNIAIGTEACQDTAGTQATCSQADLATNPDCRDFFNAAGTHFYRLESRTVTASGDCHPYRRTATGQVYNADPTEGKTCSAAANNCHEYKGNRGNNIRNVFSNNFEDGQIGAWLNSHGTTATLNVSNEAVYQGGHSLRLGSSDHLLTYNLVGLLRPSKQYTLSFWAKKADGATANISGTPPEEGSDLALSQNGLTANWQLYEIGPVTFNGNAGDTVQLRVQFNNLSNAEVVYVDNVVLKEYAESFYLIRNSWTTPAACDAPYPGAQIGCQIYQDRQNQTHFLKSFDYLCSSTAIGCEAYADTQNSTGSQGAKSYQNNTVVVPNDKIIYLVNDPSKQCTAAYQGCRLLGSPTFNKTITDLNQDTNNDGIPDALTGFETVAKLSNPDRYDSILCSNNVQYCQNFQGDLTGTKSYISPLSTGGNRTCEYNGTKWVKTGTSEDCPGASGQNLAKPTDNNYQGWVGTCPAAQSSCTQFVEQNGDPNANHDYYYLNNDSIDKKTCTSEDRAGGCISFRDESLNATSTIKVKQDRKCSEWLECQTGVEIGQDQGGSNFACLGLVKCTDDGHGGKVCVNGQSNNGSYNLYTSGQADSVNELTGYSHPGAKWKADSSIAATGYSSPEAMNQIGQKVDLNNPGFETYATSINDPENWSNTLLVNNNQIDPNYTNGNCSANLDNTGSQVHSGRYSLKITLQRNATASCVYHSQSTGDGFFSVDPGQSYVVSFYAKSQNGGQKANVGLAWYDSRGILCNSGNRYCHNATTPSAGQEAATGATVIQISPSSNGWQKYTISLGVGTGFTIPTSARLAKIYINAHDTTLFGGNAYPLGSIWFDDFAIEPALSLNGGSVDLSSKECRLYPAEDAPSCSYQNLKSYEGWNGFCLEPDPFFQPDPTQPTNWDKCLQWYPVDSLQSDRLSVFNVQDLGYKDRTPLYYCAQTAGKYNYDPENKGIRQTQGYKYQSIINVNGGDGVNNSPSNAPDKNINAYASERQRTPILSWEAGCYPAPGSSVTAAVCAQSRADQCPSGCVFTVPGASDVGDTANKRLALESNDLTVDEIGAIYFEAISTQGTDGPAHSGYLSDVTDNLVGSLGEGGASDYRKFDRVFTRVEQLGSHSAYRITMGFGKKPGDSVPRLLRFEFTLLDDSGTDGYMAARLYYYLKDQCGLIAQTVNNAGGKTQEKTYLSRFSNWTVANHNDLGYGKNLNETPYGSFSAPRSSTPEAWSFAGAHTDAPLYVYNGGSFDFGPAAGTPWSVPSTSGTDRICVSSSDESKIGQSCLTSDNCGTGGVCGGIGKYCFDAAGITNGVACDDAHACATNFTCRLPNNLLATPAQAISRIQQLFAKVYGVWQWNGSQYVPCNNGSCTGFNYTPDTSQTAGTAPAVANVHVSANATALNAPGGKVDLQFTVNGSQDQLPVEDILINWGDGNIDHFRGPLDYRPDNNNPYRAYHIYSCIQNGNGDCTACFGGVQPRNGSCTYPNPKVNIKDHWGWCANGGWVDDADCPVASGVAANSSVIIRGHGGSNNSNNQTSSGNNGL